MRVLLQTALQEFILACEADGLQKSTVTWYRSIVGAFVDSRVGEVLADVSTHDLRLYLVQLRHKNYGENTISAHIRCLHKFWGWAAREYAIPNPMRSIRYPNKPQPKPRAASLEDITAMFEAAGEGEAGIRNRAILAFLLDTGCRAAGLCSMNVGDVDLEGRRAVVTEKGNKTRAVIFTQATAAFLQSWLDQRQPVAPLFYNLENLQALKPNGLYQLLRRLARRAGIEGRFNPHSLRHTFAREYILAGGDLATLAKLLGHRDVSTTVSHYVMFTDGEIADKHEKYSPIHKVMKGKKK